MDTSRPTFNTIDEYIATFSPDVQALLQEMRRTIRETAPDAVEAISYQMPTFKLKGRNLVHFAAFKKHIGFYPGSEGIEVFSRELAAYKVSKGTVQFPLGQPLPLDLVERITAYRVKVESERQK